MDDIIGKFPLFGSRFIDNKLQYHAMSCKNRNSQVYCHAAAVQWTIKSQVNCVGFTVLASCLVLYFSMKEVCVEC